MFKQRECRRRVGEVSDCVCAVYRLAAGAVDSNTRLNTEPACRLSCPVYTTTATSRRRRHAYASVTCAQSRDQAVVVVRQTGSTVR